MVDLDPATRRLVTVASELLAGEQLASFLAVADATKLAGPNGEIDADAISGHLRTLYGISEQPQQAPRWGQQSGSGGPAKQPGDNARAALRKRHNVGADDKTTPAPGAQIPRGQGARAELEKRYGKGKR